MTDQPKSAVSLPSGWTCRVPTACQSPGSSDHLRHMTACLVRQHLFLINSNLMNNIQIQKRWASARSMVECGRGLDRHSKCIKIQDRFKQFNNERFGLFLKKSRSTLAFYWFIDLKITIFKSEIPTFKIKHLTIVRKIMIFVSRFRILMKELDLRRKMSIF